MATSTLRAALLVAAVVIGVVMLARAFPNDGDADGGRRAGGNQTTTPSPKRTSPSPSPRKTRTPKPPVKGVVVQVLNGTTVTGLAAATAQKLAAAGYTIESLGDTPDKPVSTTSILYAPDSKAAAEYMKTKQFPDAEVKPAPAGTSDVDITVSLGTDYAETAAA